MDRNISFNNFISSRKNSLNSDNPKWLIIGNEASDMDSIVSSLVYGFYKHLKCHELYNVIPVICNSKQNVMLRRDVLEWLKQFNIDVVNDLVYLDEMKMFFDDYRFCEDLRVTLVDHHRSQNERIASHVREVIDHHEITYKFPSGQLETENIQAVGSCSTLVALYLLADRSLPQLETLLRLLYGAILLDTDCLNLSNNRTTKIDIEVSNEIDQLLSLSKEARSNMYHLLLTAKSNTSGLTLIQIIQRDLKVIEVNWKESKLKIAVPTLLNTDVEDILSLENVEEKMKSYLTELDVNCLVMLTCGKDVIRRRGYVLFSKDLELVNKLRNYFLSECELKVQQFISRLSPNIVAFTENNLATTRKVFIPILENYFSEESRLQYQSNNCNINEDIFSNLDEDDVETEGAPYTLSTPLRSCSESPDTRNLGMDIPSLNNRRTLALIDQKRQKHYADIDCIVNITEEDKYLKDGILSPLAYTPENSDEDIPNSEHNFLPSNYNLPDERIKDSKEYGADMTDSASDTGSWISSLDNLSSEVTKRRHKLDADNLDSVVNVVVADVITKSEKIIEKENFYKFVLKKWSDSYTEKEKLNFINIIERDDTSNLANILTTGLIRDCLSDFQTLSNEKEYNNNAANTDIDEGQIKSPSDESIESDEGDSFPCVPDSTIPDLEINYNSCPVGTIINKENQGISNCLSNSGIDVENSSFSLYRRISSNQLDFSEDEKKLLAVAGNWYPDEDVIYSDGEQDPNTVPDNELEADISKKLIFPNKEITMNLTNI